MTDAQMKPQAQLVGSATEEEEKHLETIRRQLMAMTDQVFTLSERLCRVNDSAYGAEAKPDQSENMPQPQGAIEQINSELARMQRAITDLESEIQRTERIV